MKKSLLVPFLFIAGLLPSSAVTNPEIQFYQSDFRNCSPSDPLGGWSCHGSGKTAKDVTVGNSGIMLDDVFPEGAPAYVAIDFTDFGIVYVSNSSTVEGGSADEWLISPAIDLTDAPDNLILGFDVFAYGADADPKYEVYISTDGNSPEDFTTPLYTGKTKNSKDYPTCTRVYRQISGVNKSEVYLAFVNKSRDAQILGFKDISISEYELDIVNNTPGYFTEPAEVSINFDFGMLTPVKCNGFTAMLSCRGEEQIYTTQKQVGTSYVEGNVKFSAPIDIDFGENIDYTISITPAYEGATTSVFKFDMSCTQGYPAVCVEEEATGSWCGWCVRGIAGLNQFSDEYADRFIGIAVHSGDSMEIPSYITSLNAAAGITGFPSASFNRGKSKDPYSRSEVERILSTPVGYAVDIKGVDYDEESQLVTVKYAPKLAFDTSSANISAAVVVTEDNVTGKTGKWNQANNYSGYTKENIVELYGEDAWPYFKKYCEGPSTIPFPMMSFDHVAQGIFNGFNGGGEGGTLPAEWKADEEQEFTISFEMPMQQIPNETGVQNWKNTHIAVLILDNVTGEILTAAKTGADKYNTSGVETISLAREVNISHEGNYITVKTDAAAHVDVYNMYGLSLYSSDFDGMVNIGSSAFHGPVIVKVTRGNDSFVKKLIM